MATYAQQGGIQHFMNYSIEQIMENDYERARIGYIGDLFEVFVITDDQGKVPHVHLRRVDSDENEISVRLDSKGYYFHGTATGRFRNNDEIRAYDMFMISGSHNAKYPTNYFLAIEMWNMNNAFGFDNNFTARKYFCDRFYSNFEEYPQIVTASEQKQKEIREVMKMLYKKNYSEAYRVAVIMDDDFNDYDFLRTNLDAYLWCSDTFDALPIKLLLGEDSDGNSPAIQYANEYGLTRIMFPANWKGYPVVASELRDEEMVSYSTHLVIFRTKNPNENTDRISQLKKYAQEKGIRVREYLLGT